MAFSREDLETYEKRPQTQVDDKTNPFTGQTPPADESATVEEDADLEAAPSGEETETAPDEQGDGTSDETGANVDPSTTDSADPSGETETTETPETEGSTTRPAPKKGSAAERIQEVIDEREGYKAYGVYAQEQLAARDKEIADLRKKQVAPVTTKTAPAAEPEEAMPLMDDPRVNYDPVKYNEEVAAWADRRTERRLKAAAAAAPTQNTEVQEILKVYNERAVKFSETHKDFVEVVTTLPVFSPPMSRTMVLAEDGPALLFWLGKHKVDAIRIAKLSPEDQLMELGAIRTTIKRGNPVIPPKTTPPAPDASKTPVKVVTKSTSNAPPPPTRTPAGGRAQARDVQDPTLTMEDFARRHYGERQTQRANSRKLRGLS